MSGENTSLLIGGLVAVVILVVVLLLLKRSSKTESGGVKVDHGNPHCKDCGEQTIIIKGLDGENNDETVDETVDETELDDTVLVEGFEPSLLRSHRLAQLSNLL